MPRGRRRDSRMARRSRTFCGCSDEKMPSATVSRAPSSSGTRSTASVTSTSEARTISTRWPMQTEAGHVGCGMDAMPAQDVGGRARSSWIMCAIAAITQRALALPRMSAASSVPVPIGLVRMSASPGCEPAFAQRRIARDEPVDGKAERQLGAFAGVAADQRATGLAQHLVGAGHHRRQVRLDLGLEPVGHGGDRERRSAARRPWRRRRRANGWRRSCRACRGRRRWRGNNRPFAATACRRRRRRARRRRAHRGRRRRRRAPPARSPPSARDEHGGADLGAAAAAAHGDGGNFLERLLDRRAARSVPPAAAASPASSLNLRMKRRSIQSFQRQTQAPSTTRPLRVPTAWRSPVETR